MIFIINKLKFINCLQKGLTLEKAKTNSNKFENE